MTTLFCYGCNVGPTQTARSIKGFSRKQVAWLNINHITEKKLDEAIAKAVNAYNKYELPQFWGTGESVSVDGTKWDVYEQNLLSEFHVRYAGSGGIGYYHVSDKYIALFSHFIPCGVHEALYLFDGLFENQSDIRPDTVHGDTHAQSTIVFGLAYLLGIKIMPRIRNLKSLIFFHPDARVRYKHIDSIFTDKIRWNLIQDNYEELLRVTVSIKMGKISASTIIRRLGTESKRNKLYYAFRELGRVVRTMFLLEYISNIELREIIQAATCKSEEFNNFAKWLNFGNNGIIAENLRHEQIKVVKYNHLVANLVLLHNVNNMSLALSNMKKQGMEIDKEILSGLSPYRGRHINLIGDYVLNTNQTVSPMHFHI